MSDTGVKRRKRPNRYADDLLLDAAANVFDERGFHDAAMVDIAAEAGVTKPTLYARFGNKEALYDRVMERIAASLTETMTAGYEDIVSQPPQEATERPIRAFFDWVRDHPTEFRLLFGRDEGSPTGTDHRERALDTLTELIAAANAEFLKVRDLKPGRATGLLAAYFVGVLHHGALWAVEHDLLDRLDVGAFTSRFFLHGLDGVNPEAISGLSRRRRSP